MPHSFSVDEIQKMRIKLKSSKSYPNELLRQQSEQQQQQQSEQQRTNSTQQTNHQGAPQKSILQKDKLSAALNHEEGDNSSSGVSSDHEINMTQTHASNTNRTTSVKSGIGAMDNNNTKESTTIHSAMKTPSNITQTVKIIDAVNKKSINLPPLSNVTKKISSAVNAKVVVVEGINCKQPLNDNDYYDDDEIMDSPSPPSKGFQRNNSLTRKQAATIAMNRAIHTRNAVSLVQLPPPIEADSDTEQTATSK